MQHILWFNEINIKNVNEVGGKNASLGEMYQNLTKQGVRIPNGFAITADAYWYFLESAKIKDKIKEILKNFSKKDLVAKGTLIRGTILNADFPKDLKQEIISAYKKLSSESKKENVDVAVRSSATAEDAPDASFAGQQESYLNIKGEKELLLACKRCISSLFTDRSISYRLDKKISLFNVALSVGVQKMVRSDKASAGVMFTLDPESGFKNVIVINGAFGLGENVVKGRVIPDEFCVHKELLKKGFKPIVGKTLGKKEKTLIYTDNPNSPTINIKLSDEKRNIFVLNDKEILELAKFGLAIDEHYKRPMDIEWAKDGNNNKLYIVQARPETIHKKENEKVFNEYYLAKKGKVLLEGAAIGSKIGQGKVQLILDVKNIEEFKEGEILVTTSTDPDWEPVMRKAKAIITDTGGRTCHAAIVSRELGIPCIVGTNKATEILKDNQEITVSCAEGEIGKIYQGLLEIKTRKIDLTNLKKPKTKIMMNVGVPLEAFALTSIPNDGIGLAREEFIIANSIKIHPKALLNFSTLKDKDAKEKIAEITKNYKNKSKFFIDHLAWDMGRIAAAFYPNDVIVRTSDFKTNEYAQLLGGKEFEPKESNPMIGWRGASRYYDEKYKDAFVMECEALKKLREEMGFSNVKIMIPFCRTVDEGKKVLAIMKEHGLERGKNKLEVYVMVEIPSNVILADQFAKIFDGFSIGTNDLTQLTLGVDRDSSLVAHVYDERNEAVKTLVKQVIKVAHENKIKIGICGDAPSTFPDFAQFLIDNKIDSISLSPDAVFKTTLEIQKKEK
ncbi:MAG: phosphoenolpyruvate synthase [Patescibacteria group bacterium]|jgi:pyruvate,water dikinase